MRTDFRWCVYGEAGFAEQPGLVIYQYQCLPLTVKRDVRTENLGTAESSLIESYEIGLRDLLSAGIWHGHI